tara:strand:+ start:919 stop:1155 length:237 start_codon:yes stop_codon:yes gene_type:complete
MDCNFGDAPNVDGFWQCRWCEKSHLLPLPHPPRRNCPKAPSRGLGDTVAKMTRAVGIKPCGGCKKRQKKLNEMFPYRQ